MARVKSVDVDTKFGDGLEVGVTQFNLGSEPPVKLAFIYDIGAGTMTAGLSRTQVVALVQTLLNTLEGLEDE